ncbi:MAG: competence/damage-inducible protein A [Peptococcaceae bacterium]|nr:competence/damage-inducible protein A [Peptococcaceae bacterium]
MNAEILCIGTELLLGNIVNTNAAYLSEQLARLGINVYHHTVVGDNAQRLQEALQIAVNRTDLVIMTGGLGPTYDDLSKETVSKYFNRQMVLHQPSFEKLQEFYALRGVKMQPNNEKQAYQPEGAVVFTNHSGTAPGIAIEEGDKIAIMLPGPPRELKLMFESEVLPYLQKFSDHIIVSRDLRLFGIGESQVETMLRDIMTGSSNPTLAPYAKEGEVMLRITASAPTEAEGYAMMQPMMEQIQPVIEPYLYGVDVPDLQTALVNYLLEHNITVATAESCTGGLISKSITDVAGCSSVYPGGVCSYSNEMKMKWLDVKKETLDAYGAVSEQTALEMAQGIRNATGADFGLSTTGIAGPGGGSEEKPVGLVYMAVAGENYQQVKKVIIRYGEQTSREMIRQRSAKHALHLLLQAVKTKE